MPDLPGGKRGPLLAVLLAGVLMGALDISIIGPALPAMKATFAIGERSMTWLFSIYILFNVVGTPLLAKLSDRAGRRWAFNASVGLFTLGSIGVAIAPSFGFVLAARALQGFGAGGIFPVASAVVGESFPEEKRGSALGLIGAVFGLAFIIGPILGMVILSTATWHWLFLINVPVAIVITAFGWKLLPTARHSGGKRLDWAGLALTSIFLGSLTLALSGIDTRDALRSLIGARVLPFALTALLLAVPLWLVERRAEDPVIRPSLFGNRQLRLAYILSVGAGFGEAILVFVPSLGLASLGGYGITTANSSLLLFPVVIAMAIGSPLIGRLVDRLGPRPIIIAGAALMSVGMLLFKLSSASLLPFILAGALVGIGLAGLLGSPLRYLALSETNDIERSSAQGLLSLSGSLGQLTAAALIGAIVESSIAGTVASAAGGAEARAGAYGNAFLLIAVLGIPLIAAAIMVKKRARVVVAEA
jgi:EmrB/QacA subfamily drug resistance transporter